MLATGCTVQVSQITVALMRGAATTMKNGSTPATRFGQALSNMLPGLAEGSLLRDVYGEVHAESNVARPEIPVVASRSIAVSPREKVFRSPSQGNEVGTGSVSSPRLFDWPDGYEEEEKSKESLLTRASVPASVCFGRLSGGHEEAEGGRTSRRDNGERWVS